AYAHTAPAGASVYVADTTRNVVFDSENAAQIGHRGHVMFMHTDRVQLDAAGFYGLGRTDKSVYLNDPSPIIDPSNPGTASHPNSIENGTGTNARARYAIHFHHTMPMDAAGMDDLSAPANAVNDCAVVGSPGWGIVNHGSNVNITNNVVYGATGAD